MMKIAVGAVALVAVVFFLLHGRGDNKTAQASHCLEKAGATVQQSTFFEDVFASAAAEQGVAMPETFTNVVKEIEKRLYDVRFGDAQAMLIFTRNGRQAEELAVDAVELDMPFGGPPQRFGSVLVFWSEGPSAVASATVSSCLS